MTRIAGGGPVGQTEGPESVEAGHGAGATQAAEAASAPAGRQAATTKFGGWTTAGVHQSGGTVTLEGNFNRSEYGKLAVGDGGVTVRERTFPAKSYAVERPLTLPEMKDLKKALDRAVKAGGKHASDLKEVAATLGGLIEGAGAAGKGHATAKSGKAAADLIFEGRDRGPEKVLKGVRELTGPFAAKDPGAAKALDAALKEMMDRSWPEGSVFGKVADRLKESPEGAAELKKLDGLVKQHATPEAKKQWAAALAKSGGLGDAQAPPGGQDDAPPVTKLPSRDPLRKLDLEISEEWGDNNISNGGAAYIDTGAIDVSKGKPSDAALSALADKNLRAEIDPKDLSKPLAKGDVRLSSGKVDAKAVTHMAKALSDGFAYSQVDKDVKKQIEKLLDALGPRERLVVASAEGKARFDNEDDPKPVASFVVLNPDSGKVVSFYAQQGTM